MNGKHQLPTEQILKVALIVLFVPEEEFRH